MYRVFGSPYNLSFHQSTNYLRHKKVPFKVHNGSLTTTKLLSLWHRAKLSFCTLSPKRETLLLIHQVLERCEAETAVANRKASAEQPKAKLDNANFSESRGDGGAHRSSSLVPETILINSEMYPRLSLASWSMFLYFSSWLGSTGSLYRWVHGTGSSVVDDYVAYLSRATSIIPGAGALVSPRIRNLMVSTLAEIGITKEAEPYMIEHFMRLCDALEEHFVAIGGPARAETINEEGVNSSQVSGSDVATGTMSSLNEINSSASPYILGTSHPTLADIAMAAAFDGYFLRDDPPALDMITKYPALNRYLGLISDLGASNAFELALSRATRRGDTDKANTESSGAQEASSATPISYMRPLFPSQNNDKNQMPGVDGCDYVSETLQPILDLMAEIFPWQIAQCDAIKQFYQRGLEREKTSVVDVASELPLLLWGRSGVVGENDEEPPAVSVNASDHKAKPLMPSGVASGKVTAKVVTPKLKAAPYIMLVDRSIIPAHARCQEIELAQVCAMGAIGAYPLFTTNADHEKDSSKATSIKSCCGCSDAYLAGLQQTSPSDALYALAAKLLRESDETLDVELIDFDTHHVKSAEAVRGASGDTTVVATGAMAFQNVKLRARQVGQREQRHVYDVKMARALASSSSTSETEGKKTSDEAVLERNNNLVGTADEDGNKPSAQPPIDRIESDELLRPSGSIDYALARVAMLLGRMYLKDFEVRSVYRSRGIEFAIIPRKVTGAGRV